MLQIRPFSEQDLDNYIYNGLSLTYFINLENIWGKKHIQNKKSVSARLFFFLFIILFNLHFCLEKNCSRLHNFNVKYIKRVTCVCELNIKCISTLFFLNEKVFFSSSIILVTKGSKLPCLKKY
jgi:hypothetical protein